MTIKKFILLAGVVSVTNMCYAQHMVKDTLPGGNGVVVYEDERIGLLGNKMTTYNQSLSKKTQIVNGFRLMVLNTTDRNAAMQLRGTLLQKFPEQKVYTTFLSPYIKIKFGNFLKREDAENMKKTLEKMKLIEGNIYVISERVEKKPDVQKNKEE